MEKTKEYTFGKILDTFLQGDAKKLYIFVIFEKF